MNQGRGMKGYTNAVYFNAETWRGSYAYTVFDKALILEGLNVLITSGSPGEDRKGEFRIMLRDRKTKQWYVSSVWTVPGADVSAWARPGSWPAKTGLWSNESADFNPAKHRWVRVSKANDAMLNALEPGDEAALELGEEFVAWNDCSLSKNGMDGSGLYKDAKDSDNFRMTTMTWYGKPLGGGE